MSGGYAVASQAKYARIPRITHSNRLSRATLIQTTETKKIKMTLRKRLRNWLFEENDSAEDYVGQDISVSEDRFNSDGMRLQVYKGSGGFVIEVRGYDRKRDEKRNSMYIITDEKDLGQELGKIITMESMK